MNTNNQVVNLAPTRLPYRISLKEQYGIDESAWRTLVDAIFPSAKSIEAVEMALSYAKARNIDIFSKALHVVPCWSSVAGKMVETVWPGIALHRITATRTRVYAGCDPCQFGPDITRTFKGKIKKNNGWEETKKTVTFPEWGLFTIYKIVGGVRVAFASPRLHWLETYGKMQPSEVPNDRWGNSPHSQFEKCLEAAALRRAFPEELGSELTAEEVDGGMYYGPDLARDITPESTVVPPRPTRGDPAEAERIKAERAADKPTDFVIVDHIGEVAFEGIGPRKFTDEMLKAVKDFYEHGDLKSFETFVDNNENMLGRLKPLNFGEHEHSILTDYAITFKHLEEKFPAAPPPQEPPAAESQQVDQQDVPAGSEILVQDERKPSEPSVLPQNTETQSSGQIQPPAEIHWVALGNKPVTRTNPVEWSEAVIKQINHHLAKRESVQSMWDNLENVETMRVLLRCGGSHQEEAEAVQKAILEKLA